MLSAEAKLRRITQTEALIIPHILREPNSIIVLLFILFIYFLSYYFLLIYSYFAVWNRPHELAKVSTLRVTMFFNVLRNYVKRGIIVFNSKFGQLPSGYDDFTNSS